MSRSLSFVAILSGIIFNSACGNNSGSRMNSADSGGKKGAIVVAMGGYLSCADSNVWGTTAIGKLNDIEGAVKSKGKDFKKIVSCYDASPADPSQLQIHFMLMDGAAKADNIYSFIDQAAGQINANPDYDVYLIGHSHGGWLSLKFMDSGKISRKVNFYTSIDPISRIECAPSIFATKAIWNDTSPSNGCLHFPGDMAGASGNIRSKTDGWKNYYQERTALLHSGPTANAENIKIDYGYEDTQDPFNNSSHGKMWNDGSIWGDLKGRIVGAL